MDSLSVGFPMNRRRMIALAAATLFVGSLGTTNALAGTSREEAAAQFLEDISRRAIKRLNDTSVSEAEREQAFRELLNEAFDVPAIAQFVLGRYWRAASEEDKERFVNVLEDVVVQRFLPLFGEYDGEALNVVGSQYDEANKLATVTTEVEFKGEMVRLHWRLRPRGDTFKIVDLVAAGASLAITYRSEYGSFIQQNGGQVAVLIEDLRSKVERGAFKPEGKADLTSG